MRVSKASIILCTALCVGLPVPSRAFQQFPFDTVLLGTLLPTNQSGECRTLNRPTPSSFLRSNIGQYGPVQVEFDDLLYVDKSKTSWDYGGLAKLSFTTGNSGVLTFDAAPIAEQTGKAGSNLVNLRFDHYGQTYDSAARTLHVTYLLHFPTCVAAIKANYRAP